MAMVAAQNMVGQNGTQIASLAQEIHSTHRTMSQEEKQNTISHFLEQIILRRR